MEITTTRKVWRVGNNIVLTIPKDIAEEMGLSKGDLVEVRLKKVE